MAESSWDPEKNLERCRHNSALSDNQDRQKDNELANSIRESLKQCQQEYHQQEVKFEKKNRKQKGKTKCDKKIQPEMKEEMKEAKALKKLERKIAREAKKNKAQSSSLGAGPSSLGAGPSSLGAGPSLLGAGPSLSGTYGISQNSPRATMPQDVKGSLTHRLLDVPYQQCATPVQQHASQLENQSGSSKQILDKKMEPEMKEEIKNAKALKKLERKIAREAEKNKAQSSLLGVGPSLSGTYGISQNSPRATMPQDVKGSFAHRFHGVPYQQCATPVQQHASQLENQSRSSKQVLAPQPATPSKAKCNQDALCLFTNWTNFHKSSLTFFESQRSLLAMIRAENFISTRGVQEVDRLCHVSAADILQRVKEVAGQLQSAQVDVLIQNLVLEKELNEQLQNELKELKDDALEFTQLTDNLDHSEFAERLEFQMARLADKDAQIAELKERLSFQNRDVASTSDAQHATTATCPDTEDDTFHELSTEAVLDLEPRSLIRHIRKELGIGMESFNPVQRRIIQAMRGKLGCALEKLAHDIYSNDSQIVLELIQNADDNYYSEVKPFLSIHIRSEKSIFVTNNECGFNNANVIAISNIGASTKKDVSRFTGHKGIGFKSVFKVTRTPYIVSKEFSFRFNLDGGNTEDNIGYILPEWVEREEVDALISPELINPNMTHFYFPLSESSRFPAEELYQGIDLIPLFLRQLHHIELGLDYKKKVVVVIKQPRQNGLLEIYHLLVTEHVTQENEEVTTEVISDIKYRIYRKVLDVPKDLQIDHAGRMIPVKTELILAFPTIADATTDPREVEIQKVYSYLPVEKAGFRFLIQADFHLVSSRDKVHAQSLYNRWLSMMIPAAFKEAFGLEEISDQEIQPGALRNDLFIFLPTPQDLSRTGHSETSTDGFWRRVMKGIRDKVLDTPCVLTESSEWAKPEQVCVRPKGYEDLFTNAELQNALNKQWVSKILAEEAVYGLGCQYLSPSEALTIINHPSFCSTKRPNHWFYKVYGFLGSQIKNKSEFIDQIFCAKIFPLDTGVITSLEAGRLYTMVPDGLYKIGPHVLRLLAMDSAKLVPGDPAKMFLESVGITSMTALDVANSIWTEHQRLTKPTDSFPESIAETSCEQFWEQLRFLKDHWSEIASLYPYLESKLFVPVHPKNTKDECAKEDRVYYHFANFVYFSNLKSEYDDICPTLNDQVLFLNDQYLNAVTSSEKQAWMKFLTVQIGINKFLRVIPTDNKDYACSVELDFALKQAATNAADNGSSATWAALLMHMQKNWEHFKKVKGLVRQIRNSYSGFQSLAIRNLFPDLEPLKNLLLDKDGEPCIGLPTISGLTNVTALTDLGIEPTLDGNMLQNLAIFLSQSDKLPITDLFIWKKVYAAMVKHNTRPKYIFMPEKDGTDMFASITNIFHEIPPILKEFCNSFIFPAKAYVEVQGMEKWFKLSLTIPELHSILIKILKIDVKCKREYEMQILECYKRINELMSPPHNQGCKIYLVFDKHCFLRGRKTSNRLLMPDSMDIFKKFVIDPKRYSPILFVHPELAKLEKLAKNLSTNMNIPLLSKVVQTCPVSSFWNGYYVFAIGTTDMELPVYLSSNLTNLYRTILAEFQSKAKTLSLDENFSLGNLLRGILVFVLAVDTPKVPVAYTIYGVSRVCHEDYFIHTSVSGQVSVIVSAQVLNLPIEEHVNLHVLKQLFPPLVVDNYLKTVVKRMLEGSVQSKLETQNIIQPNDDLKYLPFQIIVEDAEVERSIREPSEKSNTPRSESNFTNQRKYPIIYAPQGKYFGAGIPGLTTNKAVQQREPQCPFDFRFPAMESQKPILEQTTGNLQHPTKSSVKRKQLIFENSSLSSQEGACTTMPGNALDEKVSHLHRDAPNVTRTIEPTSNVMQEFSKRPTSAVVTDQLIKQQSSTLSENTQTPNASLQPCIHADQLPISTRFPLDPNATADNRPNSVKAEDNSNVNATANENLERNLPRAFGGSANNFNTSSLSIRNLRNEIHSWPKIPVEDIEVRLFKGCELLYANTSNHQHTPNTDSNFGMNLRQLESEGLVAKLIGIWAEKAVYNHLLHLFNSKKPLQIGSNTLGFPIRKFGMENWVSSSRETFDTVNRLSDNSKGYDFFYEQTNGTVVYIEVKGHAAMANTFLVSSNEWEVAKLHSGHADIIYVIFGVNLNMITMEGACIEYFLEDPILLERNGTIGRKPHSYVIELCKKVRVFPTSTNAHGDDDRPDDKKKISTNNAITERIFLKARRKK